jgi:hypothetical protein
MPGFQAALSSFETLIGLFTKKDSTYTLSFEWFGDPVSQTRAGMLHNRDELAAIMQALLNDNISQSVFSDPKYTWRLDQSAVEAGLAWSSDPSDLEIGLGAEHGVPVDEALAKQVAVKGVSAFPDRTSLDAAVQDFLRLDPASDDTWALIGMHADGVDPTPLAAIYALRLTSFQQANGRCSDAVQRVPQSYCLFTTSAPVPYVLQLHMPRQSRSETAENVPRARKWLLTQERK